MDGLPMQIYTALYPLYLQALAKMNSLRSFLFLSTLISGSLSVTVSDIQGPAFQSPFAGKVVSNLTGLVTAKVCTLYYIDFSEIF